MRFRKPCKDTEHRFRRGALQNCSPRSSKTHRTRGTPPRHHLPRASPPALRGVPDVRQHGREKHRVRVRQARPAYRTARPYQAVQHPAHASVRGIGRSR